MEHPLVASADSLTIDELGSKISELNKKIGIAISDISRIEYFDQCKVDFWKILSKDFYNKNLINKLVKTRRKIYLSTGFSSINEIKKIDKK